MLTMVSELHQTYNLKWSESNTLAVNACGKLAVFKPSNTVLHISSLVNLKQIKCQLYLKEYS